MRPRRTALALKNLPHQPRRLLAALAGLGFAVVLMFMQLGFMFALLDSQAKLIAELDADLLLVNRGQYALVAEQTFGLGRVYQARACPGVAGAYPVYLETFFSVWMDPAERKYHPIRVLAFQLDDPVVLIPDVIQQRGRLSRPATALVDTRSKKRNYGFSEPVPTRPAPQQPELANRTIRLVGRFPLGTDFANDGSVVMSAANFARYFPYRAGGDDPLSAVNLGIVRLEPDADLRVVRQRLARMLPQDVTVLTKQEFMANEKTFWAQSTPIGAIFVTGTVVGFLVGVIICYQVIYSDVTDHEPQFATLKAMGYPNRYFVGLVLQMSAYLSVFSFVPGLLASLLLYHVLGQQTGLMMELTVPRALLVFVLTLVMCVVSGCLALRKVFASDPADLF